MKSIVTGSCVLAITAVLLSVPGIADADGDPLNGMTYADASAAIAKSDKSAKIIVSTVVGSLLQRDECVVTHETHAGSLSGTGTKGPVTYFVDLNCNDRLASAGTPGSSSASPEGKSEKQKRDALDFVNADPEYCNQSAKNHQNCVQLCQNLYPGKCTFDLH